MTLITLLLTLVACPTPEPDETGGPAECPRDRYTEMADLPCTCAGETISDLPDCGYAECTDEGMVYLDIGCDTGGCKGVDCG